MKLSEMRQILTERGLQLTKSLGQNFLHDGNQLRRIVESAELKPTDQVLEVGPGLGPLTELLLDRAGHVTAIEMDRRLAAFLSERFAGVPNLTLITDDGLDYVRRKARDWSDWKLVANLPYSIASPLLVDLAQADAGPERMVATLQFEVAQRLLAQPGQEAYGLLSLLVQLHYEPHGCFRIPASCFFPEPEVNSACVTLMRRTEPMLRREQAKTFVKIVKRAFSQRRKMMFKLLKADWPEALLAPAFSRAGLSLTLRAEMAGLGQLVELTKTLDP